MTRHAWILCCAVFAACGSYYRGASAKTYDGMIAHDGDSPDGGEKVDFNTEEYGRLVDNPFRLTARDHTSTFSIDVDTASYSNMRRLLNQGALPPKDAIRIEELVNYFDYAYAPPAETAGHPFRAHVAIAGCPWNGKHRLARIALKGKEIASREPAAAQRRLPDRHVGLDARARTSSACCAAR